MSASHRLVRAFDFEVSHAISPAAADGVSVDFAHAVPGKFRPKQGFSWRTVIADFSEEPGKRDP